MFETITEWLTGAGNAIGDSWNGAVHSLQVRAREFAGLYSWLATKRATASRDPALLAEYNSTMKRGATIKTTVEKTTGGIDWLNGTLKNVTGSGMNALPAIPVALTVGTIMGLVGVMGYWIADAYKLQAKLNYMDTHGITGNVVNDVLTGDGGRTMLGVGAVAIAVMLFMNRGR